MKVAVSGKGGTGKTTIAATLARCLARRGHRVLATKVDQAAPVVQALGAPAARPDRWIAPARQSDDLPVLVCRSVLASRP